VCIRVHACSLKDAQKKKNSQCIQHGVRGQRHPGRVAAREGPALALVGLVERGGDLVLQVVVAEYGARLAGTCG
jgi:hypothetical protein